MSSPVCRDCSEPIVFAMNELTHRWVPVDPMSLEGTDRRVERGVFLELHHRRHSCDPLRRFKRVGGAPTPTPPPAAAEPGLWSPHAVLFLIPGAPLEVIRAAHRALAMIHHPDRGGDSAKMSEINVAYEVLINSRS